MKEIKPNEITENMITLIQKDWMLIGAGEDKFNMMTASWGMFGNLWNRPVMNVYVRPTRYTYEFMEDNETFTCSFFTEDYRSQLQLCGTKSGRDIDKAKECGFDVEFMEHAPVFKQAKLTVICRKIAQYDLKPEQFLDASIDKLYKNDYHRVYTGEIIKVLIQ